MTMTKKTKVSTIGGGSGHFVLLSGLRDLEDVAISAIVSMSDSGGSTGRLRSELGILPPGDILKSILALSPDREFVRKFLQKRFRTSDRLFGHNSGNMLLAKLAEYDNFPNAVKALGEILMIKGRVLPVTTTQVTLVAELTDGSYLFGEAAIDVPCCGRREKIKKTFLVPHHKDAIEVYPPVIEAISNAEFIIIGPGDLYTSIIPNLLVPGVSEAIKKSHAKIIYVANIMTKFGETDGFTLGDFINETEKKLERKIDVVVANNKIPDDSLLGRYKKQKAGFVKNNFQEIYQGREIIASDFLNTKGGVIRHDSQKLAQSIGKVIAGK